MSSYGSQHAFSQQSPYASYPQPNPTYFPPTTHQPPPPGAMPIPQRPRQYSHPSHPHNSYGSQHSYNNHNNYNNSYPPTPAQPFTYSTSPQTNNSYLSPSDAAAPSQAMTPMGQPPYTQTHSYQQQPFPAPMPMAPRYDRRRSHDSYHSHHSHRSRHAHDEDYIDDSSRDMSTDSLDDRRHEKSARNKEYRPSVGEAVYRTFKALGGLLDPKRK